MSTDADLDREASGSTCNGRVHYLGPPGTYSHQVALHLLPRLRSDGVSKASLRPCATIADTLKEAHQLTYTTGQPSWALLPYENNSNGQVVDSYDIVFAAGAAGDRFPSKVSVSIVQEYFLPVRHSLLCSKDTLQCLETEGGSPVDLERLDVVSSHSQALGQCSRFIASQLRSNIEQIETSSTGEAARLISLERRGNGEGKGKAKLQACISSIICAQSDIFDLVILRDNIQNSSKNVTRFLLLKTSFIERGSHMHSSPAIDAPCKMMIQLETTTAGQSLTSLSTAVAVANVEAKHEKCRIRGMERRATKNGSVEGQLLSSGQSDWEGCWPSVYLIELEVNILRGDKSRNGLENETTFKSRTSGQDSPSPASQVLRNIFDAAKQGLTEGESISLLGIWPSSMQS